MTSLERKLNVIDESGNIIGKDTRENIHRRGLLHREIHVLFYTPRGEIIFQHRGKNKDTYPDLLDSTVGGHVEIGEDYEGTALAEIEEETGIGTTRDKLIFIQMVRNTAYDQVTNTINNTLSTEYAYLFEGQLDELKVEKNKAQGFEAWSIKTLLSISKKDKKRFIPIIFENYFLDLFRKIKELYDGHKK